jgi:archaellum component FlaG (FlaF/FlaG flagellin family)
MSLARRTFALFLVLVVTAGAMTPTLAQNPLMMVTMKQTSHEMAATNLQVEYEVYNNLKAYNDDDFSFLVYNTTETQIIGNATVTLYFAGNASLYGFDFTSPADGTAKFIDVPIGTYVWNVTLEGALGGYDPALYSTGTLESDGPDATADVLIGNIDWKNDDDDLSATVYDLNGNPAEGLNFTIVNQTSGLVYAEQTVPANGSVAFWDIPLGDYTWKVIVPFGDYLGYAITQQDFISNGTQPLMDKILDQITGDDRYYDLEIDAYYETSLTPLVGVLVNVTYHNGTVIDEQTTPANGSVIIVDLPVAFINVSVTFGGQPIGVGDFWYNLTTVSYDIRKPIIIGPDDVRVLVNATNVTLAWHLEDEFPDEIVVYFDGAESLREDWNMTSYDFTFNVSEAFPEFVIGEYEIMLTAIDENGNDMSDSVNFRVYENITPTIEGPEDVEFYFSETGFSLSWNVTDEFMNMYVLTRDGTEVASGVLNPEFPFVTYGLDNLAIGVYVFRLFVNDTSGNNATDDATVTVNRDDTVPIITYTPPDLAYAQGAGSIVRNWTATDDFKSTYTIAIDGIIYVSEDWESETIEFDFAGLSTGIHEVTLTVHDLGGNSASSTVTVSVGMSDEMYYLAAAAIGVVAVVVIAAIVWYIRYR